MDDFLTFLSNNYLYFLIGAALFFFALIGLLVEMKKQKDIDKRMAEAENEVPSVAPGPVNPNPVQSEAAQTFVAPEQSVNETPEMAAAMPSEPVMPSAPVYPEAQANTGYGVGINPNPTITPMQEMPTQNPEERL